MVAVDGVRCATRRTTTMWRSRAEELTPVVTWGVNPGQSIGVDERVPSPESAGSEPQAVTDALDYMGLDAGQPIAGMKVDVAFIGSCTNAACPICARRRASSAASTSRRT